jgi:hypothetical protein
MIAGRIVKLGSDLVGPDVPEKFFRPDLRLLLVIPNINYGGVGETVQGSFLSMGLEISLPVPVE